MFRFVCRSSLASYASLNLLEYRALLLEHRALLENACLFFRKSPLSLFHNVFFVSDFSLFSVRKPRFTQFLSLSS